MRWLGTKCKLPAICLATVAGFNYMLQLVVEIAKYVAVFLGVFAFLFFIVLRLIRHYFHSPVPAFITQLIDNPYRRKYIQKPHVIADRMQLRSGMIVLEIGPGKGNYTKAVASRILPHGKVYAVDIQESVIKRLREKVQREKIENIEPRIDDAHNLSFPNESIDRVLAMSCLPEIPNPVKVLHECYRVLRRNGIVSLCEIIMDPDYPRRKTEKRWALEAGFKLENEYGNVFSYQLNFKKT